MTTVCLAAPWSSSNKASSASLLSEVGSIITGNLIIQIHLRHLSIVSDTRPLWHFQPHQKPSELVMGVRVAFLARLLTSNTSVQIRESSLYKVFVILGGNLCCCFFFLFIHLFKYLTRLYSLLSVSRLCLVFRRLRVRKVLLSRWSSGSHRCTTRQPDNAREYAVNRERESRCEREVSCTERWVKERLIAFLKLSWTLLFAVKTFLL